MSLNHLEYLDISTNVCVFREKLSVYVLKNSLVNIKNLPPKIVYTEKGNSDVKNGKRKTGTVCINAEYWYGP